MKKIIISFTFLFLTLTILSCNNAPRKDPVEFKPPITVTIEDCEYLQYKGAQGYKYITHKGNCKNSIHCYNEIN